MRSWNVVSDVERLPDRVGNGPSGAHYDEEVRVECSDRGHGVRRGVREEWRQFFERLWRQLADVEDPLDGERHDSSASSNRNEARWFRTIGETEECPGIDDWRRSAPDNRKTRDEGRGVGEWFDGQGTHRLDDVLERKRGVGAPDSTEKY
jgi:hypothetical protein